MFFCTLTLLKDLTVSMVITAFFSFVTVQNNFACSGQFIYSQSLRSCKQITTHFMLVLLLFAQSQKILKKSFNRTTIGRFFNSLKNKITTPKTSVYLFTAPKSQRACIINLIQSASISFDLFKKLFFKTFQKRQLKK